MSKKTFTVTPLDAESRRHSIMIHQEDAESLGIKAGDHAEVISDEGELIAVVSTTRRLVEPGHMGTFSGVTKSLNLDRDDKVSLIPTSRSESVNYIRKKIMGGELTAEEIRRVVEDIVDGRLTSSEMTAFLVAEEIRDMSADERVELTRSMVETGETLELDIKPVLDVHSIGGIPGNKYAMITVPIVAASGLTIPKTSSRAITSPAGTPDVMDVLAETSFTLDEISEIVHEVNGILAWGGSVNLAPADDILVAHERPLSIDPRCQLLASVLSKKIAVNADEVLIDLPTGPGAKCESDEESEDLAHDFMNLGHRLGLDVEAAITYGGQPLGYNVGPGLEAREVLETLQGDGPNSLVEKATSLAGILLEMAGRADYGRGKRAALDVLKSGKAYGKMKEIIEAQGGDPEVSKDELPLGDKRETIDAPRGGYVKRIHNSVITEMARTAGSPGDKGAGLRLLHKEGRKVEKGEPIIEVISEHERKLEDAVNLAGRKPPFRIESMLLKRISGSR